MPEDTVNKETPSIPEGPAIGAQSDGSQSGDRHESHQEGERKRKREIGRKEWSRTPTDKRSRTKRERQLNGDGTSTTHVSLPFTEEEIENEERKPKAKMAVMIGYSGRGYKGMQINATEKTIEGDLFAAFVAAKVISKANANDHKKSSLVRCARTDKGVHAAGNMISLKLITSEENMVEKINSHLPPQIRVWGVERTTKSFSCYAVCDSRVYEYLIPSYAFLPPHPSSYLGRILRLRAASQNDSDGFTSRQAEVSCFWNEVDDKFIKPVLDDFKSSLHEPILSSIHSEDSEATRQGEREPGQSQVSAEVRDETEKEASKQGITDVGQVDDAVPGVSKSQIAALSEDDRAELNRGVKAVKAAFLRAKKGYRIDSRRLGRVKDVLSKYVGTQNFHNYTIEKAWRDPSAKRHIKSFDVSEDSPIMIGDTEWLSLKVHGQSFMMHQIRKMVSMAALVVRCGCVPERLNDSFGPAKVSVPKAPGLGLLLERPVFDTYNTNAADKYQRGRLDFSQYDDVIRDFKQREIYNHIFQEEEAESNFHVFFNFIDHFRGDLYLYLTSEGIAAAPYKNESSKEIQPGKRRGKGYPKSNRKGAGASKAWSNRGQDTNHENTTVTGNVEGEEVQ